MLRRNDGLGYSQGSYTLSAIFKVLGFSRQQAARTLPSTTVDKGKVHKYLNLLYN